MKNHKQLLVHQKMHSIKTIIFLALFFVITAVNAQGIQWENTIGGSGNDYFRTIIPTNDGGYLAGGESQSNASGDKSENAFGASDFWIIKLNNAGETEWENSIGGLYSDALYALNQTTDGGYILGGYSNSPISGDKSEAGKGWLDYWIVKIDDSGNVIWDKTIGGDQSDLLYAVEQTDDGGYILGGSSFSGISGDKTEANFGDQDYWIVKLDLSGNIEWQNTIGGNSADYFYTIHQTNDGGYIIAGSSMSEISGDKSEAVIGATDYWIVKLNAEGDLVWENTIGGDKYDDFVSVRQSTDNGFIVGGTSVSGISGDKTENCIGPFIQSDYWIVKIDADGNIEWDKTIGGYGTDNLMSIDLTSDGGYVLGGTSYSGHTGIKSEPDFGSSDYWVVKINSYGDLEWQNTIGSGSEDALTQIAVANDEGFILGGVSYGPASGNKSENSPGGLDYWIVKLFPEGTCSPPDFFKSFALQYSAKVSWTVMPVTYRYHVRYREFGSITWLHSNCGPGKLVATLKDLNCNTNYEWQVMSVCTEDGSSFSAYSVSNYFTTASCRLGEVVNMGELNVYPNPASDKINIALSGETGDAQIRIFNLNGEIVYENKLNIQEEYYLLWNAENISSGIYQLQISINENNYSEKIVISK